MLPSNPARKRSGETSRDKQKERTRRRIYEAAKELFQTKGYVETRTTDIAKAADVSQGAVHAHFRSKANILSAVLVEYLEHVEAEIAAAKLEARDPIERLTEAFERLLDIHARNADQMFLYFGYSWIWEGEYELIFRRLNDRIDRTFVGVIEEGVAAGALSADAPVELVLDLIHGFMQVSLRRLRFEPDAVDDIKRELAAAVEVVLGQYRR